MAELFGLLADTPVPTILVVAGIIFIFFSLGGRLSAGEIPAKQQRRVGVIGFVLLIGGIVTFGLRRSDVPATPPNTLVNMPAQTAGTTTIPRPTDARATATLASAATDTIIAASSTPFPTQAPSTTPISTASPTPEPIAATNTPEPADAQSPDALLLTARKWPNVSTDHFNDSNAANWIPVDGDLDSRISLTFNNRFLVEATTGGTNVAEDFFDEAEDFDAPGDFYLSIEVVGEQTGCFYGLVFRGTLSGDRYIFYAGSGGYSVMGSKITPIEFTELPENVRTPTHLEIVSENDRYHIYADGTFLQTFTLDIPSTLKQGRRVGLYTFVCHTKEEGRFTFDNFELRKP